MFKLQKLLILNNNLSINETNSKWELSINRSFSVEKKLPISVVADEALFLGLKKIDWL